MSPRHSQEQFPDNSDAAPAARRAGSQTTLGRRPTLGSTVWDDERARLVGRARRSLRTRTRRAPARDRRPLRSCIVESSSARLDYCVSMRWGIPVLVFTAIEALPLWSSATRRPLAGPVHARAMLSPARSRMGDRPRVDPVVDPDLPWCAVNRRTFSVALEAGSERQRPSSRDDVGVEQGVSLLIAAAVRVAG